MSHTDKTDPVWVRKNDHTLTRYVSHDHTDFGRPIYKRRYVLDENGERVKVINRPGKRRIQVINVEGLEKLEAAGVLRQHVMMEPLRYPEAIYYVEQEIDRGFHYETESYIYGYTPDYCTGDEPWTREDSYWNRPCTPEITGISWRKLYDRYGATKDDRKEWHGSDRRKSRDELRAYTKRANWYDEAEEMDDSQIAHSERRHTIIWW